MTEAALLKIDLKKAYDCVDWEFFHLILSKIGISTPIIEWIMACVSSAHFVVMINGYPSNFFNASRGLR